MDLMTTAQLLGNFGEFVGAIAVVLTLIYLANQVRYSKQAVSENTRTLRSTVYASWVDTSSATNRLAAQHADLFAKLSEGGISLQDLTGAERRIHQVWCIHHFNQFEAIFLHHLNGAVDDDTFESKHRNMVWLFNHPNIKQKWMEFAEHLYDERFIEYVNREILGAEAADGPKVT